MSDVAVCTANEAVSLKVFEMHMQNDDALVDCHCEANCEEVSYHTAV